MSKFFIDRPVFAWVVALLIMLGGVISINKLSVTQYPSVGAPAIEISGSYLGASAQAVQESVVQVIEQQLNGLDGLRYISSESSANGGFSITATFDQGINPDIAQVQVQNKLSSATSMLPTEVQTQGVTVSKSQTNFVLLVALYSEDGRMSENDLSDYMISNVKDQLSRAKGVGGVMNMSSQYAMRIWLEPSKLLSYQLMPSDVIAAVQTQNVQVAAGQLGGLPSQPGVRLNATVIGKSKMNTPEDFQNILLKTEPDGAQVLLKDVAEVSLGNEDYSMSTSYNGKPTAAIGIRMATGGNVLETTEAVKAVLAELEPFFPEGVKVAYPFESAPAVSASIKSVISTLIEAIVLVFIIMYLFLQNFRATIIPTLAVPVVLLGTFGVLFACGYTINIMTMFAMVLAIGLLVDDAIVVVENVERIMEEEGLPPREAAVKSMGQIQSALVGIGLVICAVFFPMAFFAGSTGIIYRQFSITIIAAMSLSVLIAVVFTPALCATMLKPASGQRREGGFFGWFNRSLKLCTDKYGRGVESILGHKRVYVAVVLGLFAALIFLFPKLPTAFLPDEDQGSLMLSVQLPPNSTQESTQLVMDRVISYILTEESQVVNGVLSLAGYSSSGGGQNSGMAFIGLKPYEERKGEGQSAFDLAARIQEKFQDLSQGQVIPMTPPAIEELGGTTGFDFYLQDRGGQGPEALMAAKDRFLELAAADPLLSMVRANDMDNQAQYKIIIDDQQARAQSVRLSDINQTMSVAWGSAYVNDFIDNGRVKQVYVQGEAGSRIAPEDFKKWYVRNQNGQMVPFAAFATGEWIMGAPRLERYNGIASMQITGQGAPGVSSGQAMARVEELAGQLPPGFGVSFTGLSYEERLAGSQTGQLYAISLIIVFLCLAALYESWSVPTSVMLVVPLGILGAVAANLLRGLSNDIFFQVGILTVIGLSAKNAILIVEFAKNLYEKQGRSLMAAVTQAAKLRLRPILMTSLAFIFGVLPMAIATGASSASQHAMGTAVVGGTLSGTCLAIFFVPLFYVLVAGFMKKPATITADATVSGRDPIEAN